MRPPALHAGAVAALAAALAAAGATTASATERVSATGSVTARGQNECRSWIEATTEGRAEHRVGAVCTSLDPGTRARGVADFPAQSDVHTDWISETGRTYYSAWQAYIWKPPSSRMEYRDR